MGERELEEANREGASLLKSFSLAELVVTATGSGWFKVVLKLWVMVAGVAAGSSGGVVTLGPCVVAFIDVERQQRLGF